jgi:[ribosomal protein S5]-alanine N-acetyltransferase
MPQRRQIDRRDDDMPAEIDFRNGERGRYFERNTIPRFPLFTERLLLREMTPEDAPALHAVLGDPENMVWYPHPYSFAEVQEGIARQIERYSTGTGLLGLVLKENGALVGDCGPVWQDIEEGQAPELEIGYHVHRAWQRRGLATEAARAARDYAFSTLGVDHVISLIRPENLPSRRVAEKNGLTLDRVVFWHGYDHCVYRLNRPSPTH